MPSWNVEWVRAKEYVLLNCECTPILLSQSSKPDLSWLMSRMEELRIPISYTKNLEKIIFTKIPRGHHGDYQGDIIRLAADKKTAPILDKVFVHELAHHVDDHEDISSDDLLIKEKKVASKYMDDAYARKNTSEYLAVGFEVYYLGTKEEKKKLRAKNPRLYRAIAALHRKFSRM